MWDYFTGDYRIRQLGTVRRLLNFTLVLATMLASYLANVDWHLPFLVYTLPAIPLILSVFSFAGLPLLRNLSGAMS